MSGVVSSPVMKPKSQEQEIAEIRAMVEKMSFNREYNSRAFEITEHKEGKIEEKTETKRSSELNEGIKKLLEKEGKPKGKGGYGKGGYGKGNYYAKGGNTGRGGYGGYRAPRGGFNKNYSQSTYKSSPTTYTPSYAMTTNKPKSFGYAKSVRSEYRGGKQSEMGMGEEGLRFFKIKFNQNVSSSGTGVILNVASTDPSASDDWTSIAALFDSYRVCAVKVKYLPGIPNNTTPTAYAPLYVFADMDNVIVSVSSINNILQYENLRVKDAFRSWQYYSKFQRVTGTATGVNNDGYIDTASPQATGSIAIYGSGFNNSVTVYGYEIITWYIACKNRN